MSAERSERAKPVTARRRRGSPAVGGSAVPAPAPSVAPAVPSRAPGAAGAQRLYADPRPGADETSFQVDNTSAAYYDSPYYVAHQSQLQPVPPPRISPPLLDLADVLDGAALAPILAARRIVFHAVGDTGAAKVSGAQGAAAAIANEGSVADAMAGDLARADPPAFFFHLGDVVYNFGEGQYYFDQFYEPFRAYAAPIFAIPGNHDGMVFGASPDLPQSPTLTAFLRNFCAVAPGSSPDAGSAVRSSMTQPGVYFTLDAPFVSIIGLYSNVLDGPGVISSQGGAYPVGDEQVEYLTGELTRLKAARVAGQRAVILAVHHPPSSVDSEHGGTVGLSADIDRACQSAGLWPDAVLSGHAHLYQRFSRTVGAQQNPYVVSGSGGFAATAPQGSLGPAPVTIGDYTLEVDPIVDFGYLTLTVDLGGAAPSLMIAFRTTEGLAARDSVTVAL